MQKTSNGVLYSASDIVSFMECAHSTTLSLQNLETPLDKTPDDEQAALIKKKGDEHEAAYLKQLMDQGYQVVNIKDVAGSLEARIKATKKAMKDGAQVIYQGALRIGSYIGFLDFMMRVDGRPSALGSYSYEAEDTKLARTPKATALVQLAYYSWLIDEVQKTTPVHMSIILGTKEKSRFRYADYARYFETQKKRFEAHVGLEAAARNTYPDPCSMCDTCKWRDGCDAQRLADDHLSQVANISKVQIIRLKEVGINTMEALAKQPERPEGARVSPQTYQKLHLQAVLQQKAKETGERYVELLDKDPEGVRGLFRLPEPNEGDMFFDMEGNPLEDGGLEYLFGIWLPRNKGKLRFKAFWAHDKPGEKKAFEKFIDFAMRRLKRYPKAHIYHYAPYERTAMQKLMCVHGTREAQVDNLFRLKKFIDLYQVVREGIRVSEPRYSIKNIEHFYLQARAGDVTNAGASIVYYERWKETGDPQLLQDIEDYNRDDVISTFELREWLLQFRDADMPWANQPKEVEGEEARKPLEIGEMTPTEERRVAYFQKLVENLPEDRSLWTLKQRVDELTYQLLDFHRREAKPEWWAMFARRDASVEDLINDAECIGGMTLDPNYPPEAVARSIKYTYTYPPQDTKLRSGVSVTRCDDGSTLSNLEVFPDENRVTFTLGRTRGTPPDVLSIGPGSPISARPMEEALFRFADEAVKGGGHYKAIEAFLAREYPSIAGVEPGQPLVPEDDASVESIIKAVSGMQDSYLFLQGPPGAGKTHTASHVITALLEQGYRVGISSNSHHAINNLLKAVEKVAVKQNVPVLGIKKSSKGDGEYESERGYVDEGESVYITNGYTNEYVLEFGANLIAGTAWLFSLPDMDQKLDFLFIDEAGQVSLANMMAMGTSAKNLVLLGDQMQLAQPSKGIHPGVSGESSLDYLLEGRSTIPMEKGIFLAETYRMHPEVCRFISEAVYDGRLKANTSTHGQKLVLNDIAHPAIRENGISYVPVTHKGCAQDSEEEAEVIAQLLDNLLTQSYRDKAGNVRPLTLDNILIVAPYNMQVNRLKRHLPAGARVGTVDKFQGQEAEVVLVSMATSDADTMPRNIEFLFSKNRLNVAISRAKSLAVMVASPELMAISCKTPEQLNLVNTLCWVTSMSQAQ